jgi:hypothetical protein
MIPLAETLVALVESLEAPPDSGLVVACATLDVPLEGWVVEAHGGPLFLASVPHTRWTGGFLPHVQLAHIELAEEAA